MPPIFVMGDVHGHLDVVRGHLRNAGLIDANDRWVGADATLVWIGDLVDRGPDGLGAIDLARALEIEAPESGGRSLTLLGNHDVLLLAAYRWPDGVDRDGETFAEHHDRAGGSGAEREGLGRERAAWLEQRPAFWARGRTLFVHADAPGILGWGPTLEASNRTVLGALASGKPEIYDAILMAMGSHHAFEGRRGAARLDLLRRRFGAERVVHGHTPIQKRGIDRPSGPRIYQTGRAVNVDGGIYRGGPGFLWELDALPVRE